MQPTQPTTQLIVNNAYIQSLITRASFTDVTSLQENFQGLYAIQDINGIIHTCPDMESARRFLILDYLIQQNG